MLLMTCLFIGIGLVNAQVSKVTGTVTSHEDGLPVVGASVLVKGTQVGTVTDIDGNFTITNVPSSAGTLVVSFIGMKTQEVAIKPVVNVVLHSDAEMLDEVMVVAYGTTKKSSFTGSAAVVGADKIKERPVANVTKALEGSVAGVQMTSGSGQPGSGSSMVIRGFGSINASSNPLYVVDGVPYGGSISAINPNDIESITVLKDASAGALYGSRGANGVVMITTKKGSEGKTTVNLKANWGVVSRAIPRYETMDEAGFLETAFQNYRNKGIFENNYDLLTAGQFALNSIVNGNEGLLGINEEYNPFNYSISELIDPLTGKVREDAILKYSEDWLDEAMNSNPLRQEYLLTLTGGNTKTKSMFSLGYLNEEGLLKTTEFERFSARANIDSEVVSWFKTGVNLSYSHNITKSAQENNSTTSNLWYSGQLMAPIYPVYQKNADGTNVLDENGNKLFDYGANRPAGANAEWNMIATLYDDRISSYSDNLSVRTYATLGGVDKGPLQGLKFSVNLGTDLQNGYGMTYYNPYNGNAVITNGRLNKSSARTFTYTLNEILSYDRKFGNHHFDVMAGHEFYKYRYDYLDGEKTGFPFGGLYELDAAITLAGASSYSIDYCIESIFSRFNYDFADKYYLSASWRTDGSSRFYKDNRWGQFWSVGANWRISEESFMKDLDWLNNMSIKASYGVQGNDQVNSYYAWQALYSFTHNANNGGATISSLENKELKWEKNGNLNIGLEFKVLDRLDASIEWYQRKTDDMLMSFPMATSTGFDSYYANIGSMRNSGFDISLGVDIFNRNDFAWRATLMGSTVKNKVLKLADKPEIISGNYIIKEGEVLNSFYTATSAGVDPMTGKQLYWVWDTDKDGNRSEKYITDSSTKANTCREIQGSRIPVLYGSFSNELQYKGFDLSFMFTYSIGGKILDGVYNTLLYSNYYGQARHKNMERAWKQPGDITDIPRVDFDNVHTVIDSDLIDASYLSLKNITLGYNLPSKLMRRIGLQNIRLTASADNVFICTHLKGMDPQYNFSGGTNFGYVPTRTVSFGIDVKF